MQSPWRMGGSPFAGHELPLACGRARPAHSSEQGIFWSFVVDHAYVHYDIDAHRVARVGREKDVTMGQAST